jgi:hypothetical protein
MFFSVKVIAEMIEWKMRDVFDSFGDPVNFPGDCSH